MFVVMSLECTFRGADYFNAQGTFVDPHTIEATAKDGKKVGVVCMFVCVGVRVCVCVCFGVGCIVHIHAVFITNGY